MNFFAAVFMVVGSGLALLAGIGVLRFSTPYARFHAAGKASPIAFIAIAIGAATELGWGGATLLLVAGVAMILTLPVGVHLLFRATYRTAGGGHLTTDALVGTDADPADHLGGVDDERGS